MVSGLASDSVAAFRYVDHSSCSAAEGRNLAMKPDWVWYGGIEPQLHAGSKAPDVVGRLEALVLPAIDTAPV
jgi:hypothetical protein